MSDRAFRILLPIWFLFLAGAIVGLSLGQGHIYRRLTQALPAFEQFGLRFGVNDSPARLGEPLSEAARRAGIADGDAVLAIDRRAVSADATPQTLARLLDRAGPSVVVRTRSAAGVVADHTLLRGDHEQEVYGDTGVTLLGHELGLLAYDTFTALVLLGVAILLFVRRPRDLVAYLLSVAFLLLIASYSWTYLLDVARAAWLVALMRPTAWCLMTALLFLFPNGRFHSRWSAIACMAMVVPWALWILGVPYLVLGLFAVAGLVAGILSIRERLRGAGDPVEKQQVKWTLLGFSAGFVFLVIAFVGHFIAPLYVHHPLVLIVADSLYRGGLVTMIACFSIGLLASLLRVRVYDADTIISRSASYALLTILLGAVGVGGERGLERLIEGNFGHGHDVEATFIAATIAAFLIVPVHGRLHRWAEKQFQKGLGLLKHELPAFISESAQTAELDELLGGVLERIEIGAHAVRGAILLCHGAEARVAAVRDCGDADLAGFGSPPDTQDRITLARTDPLFPVRCRIPGEGGRTLGWVLLGPRPDGTLIGADERETLVSAVAVIGRAIGVVRLRELRWGAMRERIERLSARMEEMSAALTELSVERSRTVRAAKA